MALPKSSHLFVFCLIILAVASVLFYRQKIAQKEKSPPSPQLQEEQAAPGYKFYENEVLGYKLQYPEAWKVDESHLVYQEKNELIIAPENAQDTARFVSLLIAPRSLDQIRKAQKKIPEATEQKILFGQASAYEYIYSNKPATKELYIPSGTRVYLLHTDKYDLEEIQKVFESFRLLR